MTDRIVLKKQLLKSDEEKYFYLPFFVPENTVKMKIELSFDGSHTIDLGLCDCNNKQNGTAGGARKTIVISENYATPGYTPCVPEAGEWRVMIGAYRISGEGVKITVIIDFEFKKREWLVGDTHVHTINSDGALSPREIVSKAEKKGFDYCFITDHNNCRAFFDNVMSEKVNIIKGEELTLFDGHINLFGAINPLTSPYFASTDAELLALITEARNNGAAVSVNHPECKRCGFHLDRYAVNADSVEIWNGPQRIDNMNALWWWHSELLKGNRITAIGGSDYHRDYFVTDLLGLPVTAVLSESRTSADIIDGIKKGRCVISSGVNGAMIILKSGDATIGDTVKLKNNTAIEIRVKRAVKGQTLTVYNNDKIIFDTKLQRSGDFLIKCDVLEKGFVRAQLTKDYNPVKKRAYKTVLHYLMPEDDGLKIPAFAECITNPIYFE